MGNCESSHAEMPPAECFMCCHDMNPSVMLKCGHTCHVPCIAAWWIQIPTQAMKCPLCMQETDECFMELDVVTRWPIGFYRSGFTHRMHVTPRETFFVKIDEDARDLAQSSTLSVWAKLLEAPPNN